MTIDIIFVILLLMAIFKGYSKGLIVALFSIIGFIAGLAAALKLSAYVSERLSTGLNTTGKWLPFVSFLLVFLVVVILVTLGARLLQKSIELIMLGWANRLGGILLYILLYSIFLSIFLFYAVQLHILSDASVAASVTYPYLKPIGPVVIDGLGSVIPIFKNMFAQLQEFFGQLPQKEAATPLTP
ncbi:MAG: CvpA family protein [Chitinophagaceae bacterium]|nr:MAG: CvpA family protein [Chitinophagaceae bacterium]